MRNLLAHALAEECNKLVSRHFGYLQDLHSEEQRIFKRMGVLSPKKIMVPSYWNVHRNFNPFKVRTTQRIKTLSNGLSQSFLSGRYKPQAALNHKVPKDDGTYRVTSIFQIPDATLSRIVYKSLLGKNRHRLSSYAYAYREDVGAHEAIANIFNSFRGRARIYVAEFDFSKFFDTIDHKYLNQCFDRGGFIATKEERSVLDAFMTCQSADAFGYAKSQFIERKKGIPQGTSVSLFLANVACWQLDRAMEKLGVGFARYADDTVVWSDSYEGITNAYEEMERFSKAAEVDINYEKSEGISLLSLQAERKIEIRTKASIIFLGYSVNLETVEISRKQIKKIKKNISQLIYCNLIQSPKKGIFNPSRLKPNLDLDYVTCISQIRRYLYGGLTAKQLLDYTRGLAPNLKFKGLMAYFPMVTSEQQLKALDGWLVHSLKCSLKLRQQMIAALGGPVVLPGPKIGWVNSIEIRDPAASGKIFDLQPPSFTLILKVAKIALQQQGPAGFAFSGSSYY